jgi:hypothetical protein
LFKIAESSSSSSPVFRIVYYDILISLFSKSANNGIVNCVPGSLIERAAIGQVMNACIRIEVFYHLIHLGALPKPAIRGLFEKCSGRFKTNVEDFSSDCCPFCSFPSIFQNIIRGWVPHSEVKKKGKLKSKDQPQNFENSVTGKTDLVSSTPSSLVQTPTNLYPVNTTLSFPLVVSSSEKILVDSPQTATSTSSMNSAPTLLLSDSRYALVHKINAHLYSILEGDVLNACLESSFFTFNSVVESLTSAITLLRESKLYEFEFSMCKILLSFYESNFMKYSTSIASLYQSLSDCAKKIGETNMDIRIWHTYYRVGFYGTPFDLFSLNGKEFIYQVFFFFFLLTYK